MKMKAMVAGIALAGSAGAVSLPDPVIWWTMDAVEDGQVKDVTGNGWDLTGLGADTYVTNLAAKGNALWFSGTTDSWATRASQPLLTSRTLSFWIWRSEDPGPQLANVGDNNSKMPWLFSNQSALNVRLNNGWVDENRHELGTSSRELVSYYGSGGGLGGYYFSLNNYPHFTHGAWTHVLYSIDVKESVSLNASQTQHTFDGTLYINGEPRVVVADGTTTNGSSSTALWLGNISSRLRPFCGALDDVRVFDTALTAEQVKAEYGRISACHARLVARYPLDTFSAPAADGSYTSPVTAGFMAGLGGGYEMTFSDHTCVTNGPAGTAAVHFDGTATTRGKVAAIPRRLEDFTVSAWIHMPTNANIIRIAGQNNNFPRLFTYDALDVHFQRGDNNRVVQYTVPGKSSSVQTFPGSCLLPKGLWQHVTYVYRSVHESNPNASKARFEAWLNGRLMAADDNVTWAAIERNKPFTVGTASHSGNATRVFEGDVRDIHIYDGALSAEDIEALYRGAANHHAFHLEDTLSTVNGLVG